MADTEKENVIGFVDKRRTQSTINTAISNPTLYSSVDGLRFRLNQALPALYTSTLLNTMTKNDMVYALRTLDDAAGI